VPPPTSCVHRMAFFWYKDTPCYVSQDQKVGSIKELFFGPENEEETVTALARLSFDELVDIKSKLKVEIKDLRKASNKVIAKAIFDKIMGKKASESSSKDVKDVKDVKSKTGASSSKDEKSLAGVSSSKDKKNKKKKKVVTPTPSPSQSEDEESEEEGSEGEGSEEEEPPTPPPKPKKAVPKAKGKKPKAKEPPTSISIATDDGEEGRDADGVAPDEEGS
jgi:hypothetical protein